MARRSDRVSIEPTTAAITSVNGADHGVIPASQAVTGRRETPDGADLRDPAYRKPNIIVSLSLMTFQSLSMKGSGQV